MVRKLALGLVTIMSIGLAAQEFYMMHQAHFERTLEELEALQSCEKTFLQAHNNFSNVKFDGVTQSFEGEKISTSGLVTFTDPLGHMATDSIRCQSVAMCCE